MWYSFNFKQLVGQSVYNVSVMLSFAIKMSNDKFKKNRKIQWIKWIMYKKSPNHNDWRVLNGVFVVVMQKAWWTWLCTTRRTTRASSTAALHSWTTTVTSRRQPLGAPSPAHECRSGDRRWLSSGPNHRRNRMKRPCRRFCTSHWLINT